MRKTIDKVILGIDPGTNLLGYGVLHIRNNKVEMEAMGVIDLRKVKDVYLKLGRIHERIIGIIDSFHPDELAIEAPFFEIFEGIPVLILTWSKLSFKTAKICSSKLDRSLVALK